MSIIDLVSQYYEFGVITNHLEQTAIPLDLRSRTQSDRGVKTATGRNWKKKLT